MITIVFVAIGLGILLALAWLLFSPRWSLGQEEHQALEIEKLQVLHCRHFPQISQLLRAEDLDFLQPRAPASLLRQWRRERARILRQYLDGLAQDFAHLERLARLLASLSPEINRRQEWEWLKLGLQFRALFGLVLLRGALGGISLRPLARLTDMIVIQSTALELRMTQMANLLPSRIQMNPQS
jgi:hypothetical protein